MKVKNLPLKCRIHQLYWEVLPMHGSVMVFVVFFWSCKIFEHWYFFLCQWHPVIHSVHWGMTPPPLKNTNRPYSCQVPPPPSPCKFSKPSLFRQSPPPPQYWFFLNPFQWTPRMLRFFILNPIKVTKFLVKIFQFELLAMTEKNIFAFKLFLLLNISDFSLL